MEQHKNIAEISSSTNFASGNIKNLTKATPTFKEAPAKPNLIENIYNEQKYTRSKKDAIPEEVKTHMTNQSSEANVKSGRIENASTSMVEKDEGMVSIDQEYDDRLNSTMENLMEDQDEYYRQFKKKS